MRGILHKFAQVYMDDMIVYSKSGKEHLKHLSEVFDRYRKYNIKLIPEKCEFFREELSFLGFKVSRQGIQPDSKLVTKLKELETPKTLKEIQRFLGIANYFRKFIKNFSEIVYPFDGVNKKRCKVDMGKKRRKKNI